MKKLEGLRETISLNKVAELEGKPVVRMSADIHSDLNNELTYTIAVIDYEAYKDNIDEFREDIDNFHALVKEREDYIISLYHPEEESDEPQN